MEQLFNLYVSTLAAPYVAGSHTAVVTSASGLPATGTFTLTVLDAGTGAVIVVLRVTARTGTTLTVTAEGTDTNAASLSVVKGGILSTAAMQQLETDWLGFGATAALPSPTGRLAGTRFKVTDGPYEYINDGAGNWLPFVGGIETAIPDAAAFSWYNQSGASLAVGPSGIITLTGTGNAGGNNQGRVIPVPGATPYTFKFVLSYLMPFESFPQVEIGWTDGTKLAVIAFGGSVANAGESGIKTQGQNWNNATSVSSVFGFLGFVQIAPYLVVGLQDDGVNQNFLVYPDGFTPFVIASQANTSFLTATDLGIFVNSNTSNSVITLNLIGLQQTQ
jgi:hypothetical protein